MSEALRNVLLFTLGMCGSLGELRQWNTHNGRATGKWAGMTIEHTEEVLTAARARQDKLREARL